MQANACLRFDHGNRCFLVSIHNRWTYVGSKWPGAKLLQKFLVVKFAVCKQFPLSERTGNDNVIMACE